MASRSIAPHPRRTRLLAVIAESPGLGIRELARRTGIPLGTLHFHLGLLHRAGLIWTTTHGPRVLHFRGPRQDEPAPVRALLEAYVLDAFDRDVIAWLRVGPHVQKRVIERYAHMPRSTVQHRLDRLVKWGFLAVFHQGRYLRYAAVGTPVAAFDPVLEVSA